jgi:hypothetical protein
MPDPVSENKGFSSSTSELTKAVMLPSRLHMAISAKPANFRNCVSRAHARHLMKHNEHGVLSKLESCKIASRCESESSSLTSSQ